VGFCLIQLQGVTGNERMPSRGLQRPQNGNVEHAEEAFTTFVQRAPRRKINTKQKWKNCAWL